MTGGRLLICPVDASARPRAKACAATLEAAGHLVHPLESLKEAWERLEAADDEVAVLAVAAGRAGEPKLAELIGQAAGIAQVVAAGVPSGDQARALSVAGACETVRDPSDAAELEGALERAVRFCRALRRQARFDPAEPLWRLLGASDEITEVERLVGRAAGSSSPVLVIGELGSGKHVVARAVHARARGPRRQARFVECPLSGVAPDHVQERLYGTASRPGAFELAHGGTLFLGDVDLLPRGDQARLLELLEQGSGASMARSDGSAAFPADVRLVVGAPVGLEDLVRNGRMMKELSYRLKVLPIRLPPLRRRLPDIPVVAGALVDRHAARMGKTILGLSPGAAALLQRYGWPGNIREMEEHVERAVRRAQGAIIQPEDLAELAHVTAGRPEAPPAGTLDIALSLEESLPLPEAARRASAAVEIAAIRRALRRTGGNVTHAARLLKVSRLHLQKRMKLYGLRQAR